MSPGLIGDGLGSTPFFLPSNLFPEPENACVYKRELEFNSTLYLRAQGYYVLLETNK